MSAVGKALVVAGGTAITAGLIWWWLREHPIVPPTPTCEDVYTESECINAGCYWYNNKCHSTPEAPSETHYDCIKDPMTGLIMCGLVEGAGVNKCDPFAPPDYCWDRVSCTSDRECGGGAKCWEKECYWFASEYLDWDGNPVRLVKFDFEKRVVGNKLIGSMGFESAEWCVPQVEVFLIRDGVRVRRVYNQVHPAVSSGGRVDPFALFLGAEAVDGIEFVCLCHTFYGLMLPVLSEVHAQYLYM